MRKALLVLLFGTSVLGQAQMEKSASNTLPSGPVLANTARNVESVKTIAPDTAVMTINGLCDDSASKKTNPSDCKTVITKSQFEELLQFVHPNLPPSDRRRFAANYAETLLRAQQAHEMGLDSGPQFEALMELRRKSVLQYLLGQALRQKAEQVPDKDIEQFYKNNTESFEEVEFEELYVPMVQQFPTAGLNPEQIQTRQLDSVPVMKKTADELFTRAKAGESFSQLQGEAYKAAGYGASVPSKVEMQKRLRGSMRSREELAVLDLKPGEISQLFDESNGYYVCRAGSRRVLPLEKVRDEIVKKLQVERLQQLQREQSGKATFNDTYFSANTSQGEEP